MFTAPWILGLLLFYAYPLLSSIYYSFTSYSVLNRGTSVSYTHLDVYKRQRLLSVIKKNFGDNGWAVIEYEKGKVDFERYTKAVSYVREILG